MEVVTEPSEAFFACPQLSDLLSQQHDFSNEIVSQREELKPSVRGLDQSDSYALMHRVRPQVGMSSWTRQDPVESTSPPPSRLSFLLVMTDL